MKLKRISYKLSLEFRKKNNRVLKVSFDKLNSLTLMSIVH